MPVGLRAMALMVRGCIVLVGWLWRWIWTKVPKVTLRLLKLRGWRPVTMVEGLRESEIPLSMGKALVQVVTRSIVPTIMALGTRRAPVLDKGQWTVCLRYLLEFSTSPTCLFRLTRLRRVGRMSASRHWNSLSARTSWILKPREWYCWNTGFRRRKSCCFERLGSGAVVQWCSGAKTDIAGDSV